MWNENSQPAKVVCYPGNNRITELEDGFVVVRG